MALTGRSFVATDSSGPRGVLLRGLVALLFAGAVLVMHPGATVGAVEHDVAGVVAHATGRARQDQAPPIPGQSRCTSECCVSAAAEDRVDAGLAATPCSAAHPANFWVPLPPTPPGPALLWRPWRDPDPVSELGVQRV